MIHTVSKLFQNVVEKTFAWLEASTWVAITVANINPQNVVNKSMETINMKKTSYEFRIYVRERIIELNGKGYKVKEIGVGCMIMSGKLKNNIEMAQENPLLDLKTLNHGLMAMKQNAAVKKSHSKIGANAKKH